MYPPVAATAESRLLQELDEYDRVWAAEQQLTGLLQLPLAVPLRMLQHDDVQVNSGTTVVANFLEWYSYAASQDAASESTVHWYN